MPQFFTQFRRPDPAKGEVHYEDCPESLTETAGYIPTDRLIQNFEEAGIRLDMARDFEFSSVDDIPEDYEPVNFESKLDALALQGAVRDRLRRHLETLKAQKLKEAESTEVKDGAS